ncbi:transposase [Catellatospora aurea]|uniref:Transposase n=1 Tax=Catellatospora aurea TaxID=1337874 RepID=A0ABW2GPS2_9ACTN
MLGAGRSRPQWHGPASVNALLAPASRTPGPGGRSPGFEARQVQALHSTPGATAGCARGRPKIVAKRQRRLSEVEDMVISLSAKGLTTSEISAHLAKVHGAEVSRTTISTITDKVTEGMADSRTGPSIRSTRSCSSTPCTSSCATARPPTGRSTSPSR